MSEELNRAIQIHKEKSFSNIIREFEGYVILAQDENDYTAKSRKIRNGDTLGFYTIERFIEANYGLTHQEGIDKLSKVKWETFECGKEGCWCLGIKPSVPVLVHGSEELYVVPSGNTYAATAKQIVSNHNKALEKKLPQKITKENIEEIKSFDKLLDFRYGKEGEAIRISFNAKSEVLFWSDKLKQLRIENNITQSQLAEKTGYKKEFISRIENGHVDMRLSTFLKMLIALYRI